MSSRVMVSVPSMSAPIEGNDQYITLDIIVDQSSVELFAGEGITHYFLYRDRPDHVFYVGIRATVRL